MGTGTDLTPEIEQEMANALGADSLRYLPIRSISRAIGMASDHLCQACINEEYPTPAGRKLYQLALAKSQNGVESSSRTYDLPVGAAPS